MADISKNTLRLLIELVKYYSQKTLGEGALSIVADGITEIAGEDVTDKINNFINQEKNAKKLLEAFHEADQWFIDTAPDNTFKQIIISMPLSAISRLEEISTNLPLTLDDSGLLFAIRNQLEKDWSTKLTKQQLDQAAYLYRNCLDRALATKLGQLLPAIFRKIERIEENV
ncbi:MAG: hypothetical protein MUO77_11375, partial [Anaerolineales bacterium]|nr:hypothetical protein [Anaerolineales bacterium]